MRIPVRGRQDFWAGLLFMVFGIAAVVMARGYPIGTPSRMGPGYFPVALGMLLTLLGLVIGLRALRLPGLPVGRLVAAPALVVMAAIVAFALLIPHIGLVPAAIACVMLASYARGRPRLAATLGYALALAAFCAALFVWGLGLTLKLFW